MGTPVQRSFAPPWVVLSHRVDATTTSSETLWPFRRLICFVLADLGPTALSGLAQRGSPICSACRSLRAVVRTPADRAVAPGCGFTARAGLRHLRIGSASACPRQSVHAWRVTRLQSSLCGRAAARKVAGPSPTRAFTVELSSHESPHWNVEYHYVGKQPTPTAGLPPAGNAALWAASGWRGWK